MYTGPKHPISCSFQFYNSFPYAWILMDKYLVSKTSYENFITLMSSQKATPGTQSLPRMKSKPILVSVSKTFSPLNYSLFLFCGQYSTRILGIVFYHCIQYTRSSWQRESVALAMDPVSVAFQIYSLIRGHLPLTSDPDTATKDILLLTIKHHLSYLSLYI